MTRDCPPAFSRVFVLLTICLFAVCLALPTEKSASLGKRVKRSWNSSTDLNQYVNEPPIPLEKLFRKIVRHLNSHHFSNHIDDTGDNKTSSAHRARSYNYTSEESPNDEIFPTSCGKITCDNYPNYPMAVIQQAFDREFGTKVTAVSIPSSSTEQRTEIVREYARNDFDKFGDSVEDSQQKEDQPEEIGTEIEEERDEDDDFSFSSDDIEDSEPTVAEVRPQIMSRSMVDSIEDKLNRPISKNHRSHLKKGQKSEKKSKNCEDRIKETFPQEALNDRNQRVLLVNIPSHPIKITECIAEKYCKDGNTPLSKVYICKTKIEKIGLETYNEITKKISLTMVRIPNGCICTLESDGS